MSIIDWIVLALTLLALAEGIRELVRRQWTNAVWSALVFALLVFMWRPMWIYIFHSIVGP